MPRNNRYELNPYERPFAKCVCGHSEEEHNERPSGEARDYYQMLEKLVIAAEMVDVDMSPSNLRNRVHLSLVAQQAFEYLAVCQHSGCLCRRLAIEE